MEYTEKHFMMEVSGMEIPAALALPAEGQPNWGLVLVPGSFYNDIDGNYSQKDGNPFEAHPNAYAQLSRQLAGRGVAVLRFARSGTRVLDAEKAAALSSFAGRVEIAAGACETLRNLLPGLSHLALAGHSEGAAVSLLLLSSRPDVPVDAYVSLSGPGLRFFDVMIEQVKPNVQDGMLIMWDRKVPFDLYCSSIELIRAGQPIPEDLRKELPPYGMHTAPPEGLRYLRDYDSLEPGELLSRLNIPVLIVQGGQDTSVLPQDAERLAASRPGKEALTARAFFPELNHFYKVVPPGLPSMDNFALETETDERVSQAVSDWLNSLAK
jgi:uncharacterized protein